MGVQYLVADPQSLQNVINSSILRMYQSLGTVTLNH